MELGYSVIEGLRPAKPENAAAIGFSDSLWEFAQRCWDGNMRLRPKVTEVVAHLEEAAANWHGAMAPCVRVGNLTSDAEEPMSDTMAHRKFEIDSPYTLPIERQYRSDISTVSGRHPGESHRFTSYLWTIQPFEYPLHPVHRIVTGKISGGRRQTIRGVMDRAAGPPVVAITEAARRSSCSGDLPAPPPAVRFSPVAASPGDTERFQVPPVEIPRGLSS